MQRVRSNDANDRSRKGELRMTKRNMQFRFKIFMILRENEQMNTREIYEEYLESNPKSIPAFNKFSQLLKCKWFENLGITTSRAHGQLRVAVWACRDEFRQYPPMMNLKTGKMIHEGGRINYEMDAVEDYLPLPNIFDDIYIHNTYKDIQE